MLVLADFYKFHWTFKVYATLTMRNRFLGVQFSLIWVVFAIKLVTLLWQPVKSHQHIHWKQKRDLCANKDEDVLFYWCIVAADMNEENCNYSTADDC